MSHQLTLDLLCIGVCVIATVTDLRSQTIPNWLTLGGIVVGFGLSALLLDAGWIRSLVGLLLLGTVFGLFGAVRFVGMGDVKLMAAVGAFVGGYVALWTLAYVGIAGGLLALGYSVARGEFRDVLANLGRLSAGFARGRDRRREVTFHRIPYAAAILAGTGWAIAGRYFPMLQL